MSMHRLSSIIAATFLGASILAPLASAAPVATSANAVPVATGSIASATSGQAANAQAIAPQVKIADGTIEGGVEDGVAYFKGIPFAKPPVGELRWRPPAQPDPWQGVLQTKEYRDRAAQKADLSSFAAAGGSEDCLYLNVFVPEKALAQKEKLPVFVWIHGGGLNVGSASDYDPTKLVKEGNSAVVTINYRLGILGFFAHPALTDEGHAVANYGLMDQVQALQWVHDNIGAFGGDNENVTIAGESSGGVSVMSLMASPKAAGLFQNAICMSGYSVFLYERSLKEAEEVGIAFAESAGLPNATAEELRALPVTDILEHQVFAKTNTPIVDGQYLPEGMNALLDKKAFNRVNFLNGSVRNEGDFFAGVLEATTGEMLTGKTYAPAVRDYAKDFRRDIADAVLKEYPLEDYGSPAEAYSAIVTSAWFSMPAYYLSARFSEIMPTYTYEFADTTAPHYLDVQSPQRVAHTYELPYLFPDFHGTSSLHTYLNEEQEALSREMIHDFTHVSELKNDPRWQAYDPKKNNIMIYKLPHGKMAGGEAYKKEHHIDFWLGLDLFHDPAEFER